MTISALTATSARAECDIFHCEPRRRVYRKRAKRRYRPPQDVRYYAPPVYPDDDNDRRFRICKDKVRGVGTQWVGEQGALDAAKKDWMERVRYDLGETYLDMSHAEDFIKRCGRTSIGEVAGQVLYRCEIIARPCKAEFTETEGQR